MPIDIGRLSEPELIDLNHRIVARLRFLREIAAHGSMLEFRIGERVLFHPDGRTVTGVITRYNKKTVSLLTDAGQRWTVAPQLLERVGLKASAADAGANKIIALPRPDHSHK